MSIDRIMSKKVVCVGIDDRLAVVRELFIRHKFHHLLVVNKDGELMGVISDRDYFKATTPNVDMPAADKKDLATLDKRVHQILNRKLIAVNQGTSLKTAITTFKQFKISCLPVVDNKNLPVGVITWRDLINWLYTKVS